MFARPHAPESPADFVAEVIADLDRLDLAAVADPLRPALERVGELDEAEHDLPVNVDAYRRRLFADLDAGTVTPAQAVDQWAEATARVAAARDVRQMLDHVRGGRGEAALRELGKVDWSAALGEPGRQAAARVVELATKVGPDMTDARAVRATDGVRKAWLELGAAVARWSALGALAGRLRRHGVMSYAPVRTEQLERLLPGEWAYAEPLRLPRRGDLTEVEHALAAVHAGAVPAWVSADEVARRIARRERLVDANAALVQMGVGLPGVDQPEDVPIPSRWREHFVPVPA